MDRLKASVKQGTQEQTESEHYDVWGRQRRDVKEAASGRLKSICVRSDIKEGALPKFYTLTAV